MLAAPEAVAKVEVITIGVAVAVKLTLVIIDANALDKVIGVAFMFSIRLDDLYSKNSDCHC